MSKRAASDRASPSKSAGVDPAADDGHRSPEGEAAVLDIRSLVHQYHAPLYRYAYRLTGSQADAEDLTQQTYLLATQRLSQLRDPSRAGSWLYAILRSCFLKSCRKQRPLPAGMLELELDEFAGPLPAAAEIDGERLQLALAELPDEFRLVLVMFYFEESSYKEIAAQLEIPVGTVMSRLSRGKAHLRQRLLPAASPEPIAKAGAAGGESPVRLNKISV